MQALNEMQNEIQPNANEMQPLTANALRKLKVMIGNTTLMPTDENNSDNKNDEDREWEEMPKELPY